MCIHPGYLSDLQPSTIFKLYNWRNPIFLCLHTVCLATHARKLVKLNEIDIIKWQRDNSAVIWNAERENFECHAAVTELIGASSKCNSFGKWYATSEPIAVAHYPHNVLTALAISEADPRTGFLHISPPLTMKDEKLTLSLSL